ncbi:hypothetical protein G6F37_010958 [Rhizopus arrhizus]|nr:hypothetical protein G6F38_011324 [Rhizopus arrhizus]KAG1151595.1 hypothetical protein G6F37_010958 [Rhizopus arrhizus]
MNQTITRKLLVVGGSGFLGLNVCKLAVQRGWETVSLSRRGEPASFQQKGKPEWAEKVHWASGNSLEPSSYEDLLPGVTDVVHSVGILMETNNNGSAVTFEMMNRDTAITVANEVAKLPSIKSFVYISASEISPLVNQRYYTSKREAEDYLFKQESFKAVALRPGLMYNSSKPFLAPVVALLKLAKMVTSPFKEGIERMPGGKMFTVSPLETEQVAKAVIASIETAEQGVFDVEDIEKLSQKF